MANVSLGSLLGSSAIFKTPSFVPNDKTVNDSVQDSIENLDTAGEGLVKRQESQNYGNIQAYNLQSKFAASNESKSSKPANKPASFIESRADALINSGKVTKQKVDASKFMDVLAQQAVKNPKLAAIALNRPEIRADRYHYAKGLSNRLTDQQLKQLSQTEEGRTFLRTMMDIVYTEAPPERANPQNETWRQIDNNLLFRVQNKVLEYSGKSWAETKPFANEEIQGDKVAKFAKQADAIINLGKVSVKEIEGGKLMNILAREALKRPGTVTAAIYRPEVRGNSYEIAKGILNRLSDEDLQELARTQPGQTLLKNLYNTTLSEAPPERANNKEWLNGEMQLLGRVTKALEIDQAQRAQFQGVIVDQLVQAMSHHGLSRQRAAELLPYLNQAMYEYKIDTPMKQAMFLAQVGVESKGLTDFTEDAGERNPNLWGGWYGRGAVQLTKIGNYQNAEEYFGIGLMDNRELASDPRYTFQIDGWFSTKYDGRKVDKIVTGNPATALAEFNSYSQMVNGLNQVTRKPNGYEDRMFYFKDTLNALNVPGKEIIISNIDNAVKGVKRQ